MNSAIQTIEQKLHKLEVEKRIWEKEPNRDESLIEQVEIDIEEHELAFKFIKQFNR